MPPQQLLTVVCDYNSTSRGYSIDIGWNGHPFLALEDLIDAFHSIKIITHGELLAPNIVCTWLLNGVKTKVDKWQEGVGQSGAYTSDTIIDYKYYKREHTALIQDSGFTTHYVPLVLTSKCKYCYGTLWTNHYSNANDRLVTGMDAYFYHNACYTSSEGRAERKKAVASVKNYLHNNLGLTKSAVNKMITSQIDQTLSKMVHEKLTNAYGTDPINTIIRSIIKEEIQKQSPNVGDRVKSITESLVTDHIVKRLKLDIRVTSIKPEDGVDTEVVSPFREARE